MNVLINTSDRQWCLFGVKCTRAGLAVYLAAALLTAILCPPAMSQQMTIQRDTLRQGYITEGGLTLGGLWPTIQASYVGLEVQDAAIGQAKLEQRAVESEALPELQLQAQNTYGNIERSFGAFFPLPGIFTVNGVERTGGGSSAAASGYGSATVDWEIFAFGKHRLKAGAAGALVRKAEQQKAAYLLALKKTLTERYIRLLYADAKLKWADKNAVRLSRIREITSGLSKAGLRPAADSLLATSSFIQAKGEADKWAGVQKAAYIRLLELFRGGADTGTLAVAGLDYRASARRFMQAGKAVSGLSAIVPVQTLDPGHPTLSALTYSASYYRQKADAQLRAALPSVHVLGGYAYRTSGIDGAGAVSGKWTDGFDGGSSHLLAGIGLTWDLTSLRTRRLSAASLVKAAEKQARQHQLYQQKMEAALSGLQVQLQQQYLQLEKARRAVLESADAYDMYLARYKSGIISLTELLQIRSLVEQTENTQIEAASAFWQLLSEHAALSMDFGFLFTHL